MNNYLVLLGSNFANVRQLLNLTQEELANRMGVSRPTIVKIEQEPLRLTKNIAYAFFVAISYEINKRLTRVKELDPSLYKSPEKLDEFIDKIRMSSLLPIGSIVTAGTTSLGGLIPGIGGAISASLKLLKKEKPRSFGIAAGLATGAAVGGAAIMAWDAHKAKKMIEEVKKKLQEDQGKIIGYLELSSLNIIDFVEKIEKNESETNKKEEQ